MHDSITVTVLVENTAFVRDVRAEHGLAFWIEIGQKRVLFDTGQTPDVLWHNAELLGIDLGSADAAVVSHGHFDHTGALSEILATSGGIPLFLHPEALAQRFSQKTDGTVQEIGAPSPLDEAFLTARASSITWTTAATTVADEVRVTGWIPRETGFEDTGGDFYLDPTCRIPDPIKDDQAVFFDTQDGIVILLGCSHAGVVNTLRHVSGLTGGRPIHTVIGGMHLIHASANRLDRTVEALREVGPEIIAPAHCTGPRAQARFGSEFPDQWEPCQVGKQFEFRRR